MLDGSGNGTKVIVVGAGPGGCPAAYELMKLGYDVTVIEARDRLGGHVFTVRGGSKTTEYGKGEQVCDWDDENMWYDAGPSRIPFYHRSFFHYAKELNVPLQDHKNLDLNGWVYAEDIDGALNGTRMRLHEMQADMGGYTSQLLAQAVNQDDLDLPITGEDRDQLIDYLINWGILSSEDLTYGPSDHRGYSVLPDTQSPGEIADPYAMQDLFPFAAAMLQAAGGYLATTPVFDWQTTLVKPKGGVTELYETGFKNALGDRVRLNCEATEIRQSEDGVRVVFLNKETGETEEVTGDYCMCNIPLSVLIKLQTDVSAEFRTAMQSVPYAMALRLGLGFKRRFWEEDDWIYGGQSFSNIPTAWHPRLPGRCLWRAEGRDAGDVQLRHQRRTCQLARLRGAKPAGARSRQQDPPADAGRVCLRLLGGMAPRTLQPRRLAQLYHAHPAGLLPDTPGAGWSAVPGRGAPELCQRLDRRRRTSCLDAGREAAHAGDAVMIAPRLVQPVPQSPEV